MENFVFGQIAEQDVNVGYGTFGPVVLPDGSSATLNKISIATFTRALNVIDFGADRTGLTGSSTAFQSAIDTAKSLPGTEIIIPPGIYKVHELDLSGCTGLVFRAGGASFYDGNPTSIVTAIKYDGPGGTGIFQVATNADNVQFHNMLFVGPSLDYTALSGYALQYLDASAANNLHWRFEHCVFAYLDMGVVVGSAGGSTGNQYLWHTFYDCSFWSLNRAFFSQATNVQQIHFEDCQFANCWERYIYATAALDFKLDNPYFGIMGPAALAAIEAPMTIKWYKGWSEITQVVAGGDVYGGPSYGFFPGATAVPLIIGLVGGSNPGFSSILSGLYHPRRGDSSGYSIYWDGGPLEIEGGGIGGLIRWDSRLPWNRVHGVPSWIPCVDSDIVQTAGVANPNHPWVIGPYSNATAADFYIEIVDSTHFKWKKTSGGAFSAPTPIIDHVNLQENLIACFQPGATWTTGQQWKLPCSITGMVNFAGFRPEGFIGIRAFRNGNVTLVNNVAQTMVWNTEQNDFQDIYQNYDATTGIFTCMFSERYEIDVNGQLDTSGLGLGVPANFILLLYINGVEVQSTTELYPGNAVGVGQLCSANLSDQVYLNQGDQVRIDVKQINPSAVDLPFIGSGNVNKFYIGMMDRSSSLMQ